MAMKTIDPTALRLAAVVESSDEAIISQALDGRIETWNRAAERLFGYTASEAIGRSSELLTAPEHAADEQAIIGEALAGQSARRFETVALTRDGRSVPISVTISPILTPDGE